MRNLANREMGKLANQAAARRVFAHLLMVSFANPLIMAVQAFSTSRLSAPMTSTTRTFAPLGSSSATSV